MRSLKQVLIITVLISFLPVYAQSKRSAAFRLGAGRSIQLSPETFQQNWENKINILAGVELPVSRSLNIGINANFNLYYLDPVKYLDYWWELYDKIFRRVIAGLRGKVTTVNVSVDLKKYMCNESKIRPYVQVGAGLMLFQMQDIHVVHDSYVYNYYDIRGEMLIAGVGNIGIGVNSQINKSFGLFIESTINLAYMEYDNLIRTAGFKKNELLQYYSIRFGVFVLD